MTNATHRVLVLGVGNILFTDEGLGVRVIEKLLEDYDFPDNVTVMDGGTLGSKLMGPILDADRLIVVDAVFGGDAPGSVYRLTGDDLRKSLAFKNSMHQTDLVDTLIHCGIVGNRPETCIIGVEPQDLNTMAVELSPLIQQKIPAVCAFVLDEILAAGGAFTLKEHTTGDSHVPRNPGQDN